MSTEQTKIFFKYVNILCLRASISEFLIGFSSISGIEIEKMMLNFLKAFLNEILQYFHNFYFCLNKLV